MKTLTYLILGMLFLSIYSGCKKIEPEVTGIVEGTVTNAQSLDPIQGATVTIGTSSSKTTGSDGKFRFENMEPKEYNVQVRADGYETNTKTVIVISGEIIPADISLTPLVPILNVSATNLSFGMDLTILPITISNTGKNKLDWIITEDIPWLSVNPSSGSTTSEMSSVNLLVDRTGLSPKEYTQNVIINSNGGSATIDISMIVQGPTPTAIFTVSPPAGALSQSFQVDATDSRDDVDPNSSLFVRWRWDDGETFTEWTTIKTALHQYLSESSKNITLEVKDSDGHIGTSTKSVLVSNSLQLPYVVTLPVTNIVGTTAQCGGNITTDGGSEIIARGVCWSKNQSPSIFDTKTFETGGLGEFISYITGLTSGSTYYVRAYATNSQGTSYGNQIMFVAGQNISTPAVTTAEVTAIKANTATCGGTVSSEGSSTVISRGVCWSTGQSPVITDAHTTDGSGTGTYSSSIIGLSASTTYYVRAYATNSSGTSYGNEISFTSKQEVTVPGVTTTDAYNISESSAISGGNVILDGGATVVARGVCWSTSQNPTINDPHTSDGSGLGSFTSNITGLASSTKYYYRAYSTNSAGTGYGSQNFFTTDGSLPSVTTSDITNFTETSAIAGGAVISTGGSSVSERGICYSTSENPTIYDKKISSGSGTGGFSVPLTILIPNTLYYVKAYAINGNGTGYGDNKSFSTLNAYYAGFENGMPEGWTGMCSVSPNSPYEGYYCLKSSNNNDTIVFTRTVISPTGGWVSFITKCSENAFEFYIDGEPIATLNYWGQWHEYSFPVSVGNHTFKWVHVPASYVGSFDIYLDYFICTN